MRVRGEEVEGQRGEGVESKKKKERKQKNYRPIPSRSGLVKTFYINRGVVGSKIYAKHKSHTNKSHARVRKNSLDPLTFSF